MALWPGHDSKTGLTVELMTASFGTGDQTELEAAFVRVAHRTKFVQRIAIPRCCHWPSFG